MKATLEFTLPEEAAEHEWALYGRNWRIAVESMDNWLRSEIKHGDRSELQDIRDKLHEIIDDYGLRLHE